MADVLGSADELDFARYLRAGDGVTETCLATGFNNLSHFIRTFRRVLGVPPSRFRA